MEKLPSFKDDYKPLIVVTTVTPWDEPPRIRHQVTLELSKEFNVLFIQTYPINRPKPKKISDTLISLSAGRYVRGLGRLFLLAPKAERVFKRLVSHTIEKIIKFNYPSTKTYIVNFNYDFPEIFDLRVFKKKIFVCNDDFVALAKGSAKKEHARKRLKMVIEGADITFAVSNYLLNQCRTYKRNVALMRHGVNFIDDRKAIKAIDESANKIINVCYMGYINDRVNVEWIAEILKENRIFFWFIGPVDSAGIKDQFSSYQNCRFVPSLYGTELLSKLTEMDVLVMPYATGKLSSEEIKSLAPNKTFLYLNAGRPIVTSDLPYIEELPAEYFYIARSKDEFRELVVRAAKEDDISKRIRRFNYARDNSWDTRITSISNFLKQSDLV